MKRAVIIGASSGIGKELAKALAKEYDVIGLTAVVLKLMPRWVIYTPFRIIH